MPEKNDLNFLVLMGKTLQVGSLKLPSFFEFYQTPSHQKLIMASYHMEGETLGSLGFETIL